MKRLTGKRDGRTYIAGCPDFALPKIAGLIIQQAADRLAAYEDTGLEPEDVTDLMAAHGTAIGQLTEYRAIGPIDRLLELVQADKEGRCVMLPVKPGTPVWSIAFCKVDDDGTEYPTGPWPFSLLMLDAWGEEWFLTREEAEKALEE